MLVEVRIGAIGKKHGVGVQAWVRNVAPKSGVILVQDGISWVSSDVELARAIGQWFVSAVCVLEECSSGVVVRIVELDECHVYVSSETKVLVAGYDLARLGAGSVLS